MLGEILGEGDEDAMVQAEIAGLDLNKPVKFYGSEGAEVVYIRNFEDTCVLLSQSVAKDPKKMTVLEFFRALEVINEQNRRLNGQSH